jgi:hypothetical protein
MDLVSLSIELSGDMVERIKAIAPPGRTVEKYAAEILVGPVLTEYFVMTTAPEEYYQIEEPVSAEEAEAARRSLGRAIEEALGSGQRKEAVGFGLMAAALDLCVGICRDARYRRSTEHGQGLALKILDDVIERQRRTDYAIKTQG